MDYNLEEAARILGVKPASLRQYVCSGLVNVNKTGGTYVFSEDDLKKYRQEHRHKGSGRRKLTAEEWARNFDRWRGEGAYQKLLGMFENPCITYADIADEFYVTRALVEYWHNRVYPNAEFRERQKTCTIKNRRQELFRNEDFRAFYRAARRRFPRESIEFIQRSRRFSPRAVNLKSKKVLIRKATKRPYAQSTQKGKTYRHGHGRTYTLHSPYEDSDYVFYRLRGPNFLFMPPDVLPPKATLFVDSETSKYHKFRNNFDVLLGSGVGH